MTISTISKLKFRSFTRVNK